MYKWSRSYDQDCFYDNIIKTFKNIFLRNRWTDYCQSCYETSMTQDQSYFFTLTNMTLAKGERYYCEKYMLGIP